MTDKERRWKNCTDWFNANPNVKNYFIKAFTRVGCDNPFYEMEQGCKFNQLYNTTRRIIRQELSGIECYFLSQMGEKMITYCRRREL